MIELMDLEEVPILELKQKPDIEMLSTDGEGKDRKLTCDGVCIYSKHETTTSESKNRSELARKLCGLVAFYLLAMIVEVVGGMKANSLAVITDAGHLLTDIAGFLISLLAVWASGWQASSNRSYGYYRLEILGALLSVQLIWLISGVLVYESIDRVLHNQTQVNGKLMFLVAAFGFIINLIMVLWLGHDHSHHSCTDNHHHHHDEEDIGKTPEEDDSLVTTSSNDKKIFNINLQGAHLHAMADLIQSVGVMIAGAVIWIKPNWLLADLICTLVFSILVLGSTISMLRNIFSILMNKTPQEIDVTSLETGLRNIKGVQGIHDLHIWAITVGKSVLTCHVIATPGVASNDILNRMKDFCVTMYGIHHMTVQIE